MTDQTTHRDIADRLDKGNERFAVIESKLVEIADHLKALDALPQMQADIAATKEIVEAWSAVKWIGRFFKWLGIVAAAVTALAGMLKMIWKGHL